METKKLELKKTTIAVLNDTSMNQIVGGRTIHNCNGTTLFDCNDKTNPYTSDPNFSCTSNNP